MSEPHETVHLTDDSMRPVPGERPTQADVVVRSYSTVAHFQAEVGPMSAAGWIPISQVETTGKFPPAAGLLALIGVAVALIFSILFGFILIIVAILVGMVLRPKALVVTYRPAVLVNARP